MKVYIGIDAHTTNYTLSSFTVEKREPFAVGTYSPDYMNIVKYVEDLKKRYGEDLEVLTGYEAGCLGFSLYHDLESEGINCVVMAPSTMPDRNRKRKRKTDKRDAMSISRDLAFNDYSAVHVPDKHDAEVKAYIRMRDDHKIALKRIKQQIIAYCHLNGWKFEGKTYWSLTHLSWLKRIEMTDMQREIMDEYLMTFDELKERVKRMDARIEEISNEERYHDKVKRLICLKGIKTTTALALVSEISDFDRFSTADNFSSFLGLVPGENSSSDDINRLGITKTGNTHLRRLLVEAAQCYCRTTAGKSREIRSRQSGNLPEVIRYADKSNERLRKKFIHIALKSNRNIAATAVARELSCFVWGMMTDNIS